jgi:hypothetical protein
MNQFAYFEQEVIKAIASIKLHLAEQATRELNILDVGQQAAHVRERLGRRPREHFDTDHRWAEGRELVEATRPPKDRSDRRLRR